MTPALYATKIISLTLSSLHRQTAGAREGRNIEYIHEWRVASRRLRNALKTFETIFPSRRLKIWQTAIASASRALGPARDLDVKICFLESLGASASHVPRVGLTKLIQKLKKERTIRQEAVIKAIDLFEKKRILADIDGVLKVIQSSRQEEEASALAIFARKRILKRVKKVLDRNAVVYRPRAVKELHLMRIAVKRLRYTLEVFRDLYGPRTDVVIDAVRNLQGLLGQIHDFDIWIKLLPRQVAGKAGEGILNEAIEMIRAECRRRRKKAYGDFVRGWQQAKRDSLWRKINRLTVEP